MKNKFITFNKNVHISVLIIAFIVFASIGLNAKAPSTLSPSNEIQAVLETPELDSKLISVSVNGIDCTTGNPTVTIYTDQVFQFLVEMENTGTETWGRILDSGERGAAFLSRDPDYNNTFGIAFISPGQTQKTAPGETFTYNASLRAPATPGDYSMNWQMADWIIPYGNNYQTKPFYGEKITVAVKVIARTEQPPGQKPRLPGVIDISDFEYEGSFSLPPVPDVTEDKAYFPSGITLRTVNGEKRMLLATGTYAQYLYEVAIPEIGKFVGTDFSAVPIASFRTFFGSLTRDEEANNNGTIWYDKENELFYWTNYNSYYAPSGKTLFPILRSAKLEGSAMTELRKWVLPENTPSHFKSFWGGVTGIPNSFAEKYTNGHKIALGFGGSISIIQTASLGPSLAAISTNMQTGVMSFQNIMYYPFPEACMRDGNYFLHNYDSSRNPTAPWLGSWTDKDRIYSGVFIDTPNKKGYVAFVNQAIGRIGYDYGGSNWMGKYQNVWYIYDYETLGEAATGGIPNNGIEPANISIVEYPTDLSKEDPYVAGSCFDPETGRLYLYTLNALKRPGMFNTNPVVHVYTVKDGGQDDDPPVAETPELDNEIISVSVNGEDCMKDNYSVTVYTDQVFQFAVTYKNTGTATWGQHLSEKGERGASLLSRDPDYNDTFGTAYISPGQTQVCAPGKTHLYNASLRAPANPGVYTTTWQMADWIIPYRVDYQTKSFYGERVSVTINVVARTELPPEPNPRIPGLIDVSDFEYKGSFSLPKVPDVPQDEKAFFNSGITLRTVAGEKRMLLTTGTYNQYLYDVAIPELGKFVGNDFSAVPTAELRTMYGNLVKNENANTNGTMWYDAENDLLYWTNYHAYYTTGFAALFPVLRSAKLDGGVLTEVKQWHLPASTPSNYKSFWGGVTKIPNGFAEKYTNGHKIALGFGGAYSIIQTASMGPSIAAITPNMQTGVMDIQNIMYYPFPETCIRDGNYFYSDFSTGNPTFPWLGTWTNGDRIYSGLFIDTPNKKGYIAFVNQVIGRLGYDYGGSNWNGISQNVWYVYDYETLGKAATGEIPNNGIEPASISIVEYPHDLTKKSQYVAGSCFDPETGLLYLYTMKALKRLSMYDDPVVHVYSLKDAETPTGDDSDEGETPTDYDPGDDQTATDNIPQNDFKAWSGNGLLHVSGLTPGKYWSIYNSVGKLVHHSIATGNNASVSLQGHGVYFIISENKTIKVVF